MCSDISNHYVSPDVLLYSSVQGQTEKLQKTVCLESFKIDIGLYGSSTCTRALSKTKRQNLLPTICQKHRGHNVASKFGGVNIVCLCLNERMKRPECNFSYKYTNQENQTGNQTIKPIVGVCDKIYRLPIALHACYPADGYQVLA